MTTIEIGGRKIPLLYTTCELIEIQKAIGCTGFQLKTEVFGVHLENEDDPDSVAMDVIRNPEKIEKLCKLIRIMGNAGLEENGETADLTDKWVRRHIKPVMILPYAVMTLAEVMEGNRMESPKTEGNRGPIDEGLEEENEKKQPGN